MKVSTLNCIKLCQQTGYDINTFSGVLLEKDILTLPQLTRTLWRDATNCLARSTPYLQKPTSIFRERVIIFTSFSTISICTGISFDKGKLANKFESLTLFTVKRPLKNLI